jgi:hypothetical protein
MITDVGQRIAQVVPGAPVFGLFGDDDPVQLDRARRIAGFLGKRATQTRKPQRAIGPRGLSIAQLQRFRGPAGAEKAFRKVRACRDIIRPRAQRRVR